MISQTQIPDVITKIRDRVSTKGRERRMELQVEDRDYRLEDDYLYVCVYPVTKGIRPYDYAEILAETEKELRDEGIDNVLIVPTRKD